MMRKLVLPFCIVLSLAALYSFRPGCLWWFTYIKDWPEVFEKMSKGRGQWQVACVYGVIHGLCVTCIAPWYSAKRPSDAAAWKTVLAAVALIVLVFTFYGSTTRPASEGWLDFSIAAFLETCLVTSLLSAPFIPSEEKH